MATEAQRRARNKWNEKNKDKKKVYIARSTAKRFVKEMATSKDIDDLRRLLDQRENELKG